MSKKYEHEDEIFTLVREFESATIAHDDWKHAEHLVVALYYVSHHNIDTATSKMRDGILNLLKNGFKVDLEKEMPYHETLTVFWMRTIAEFNASKNGASLIDKANEVVKQFDKNYPLKFYSREVLFSDEARVSYLEADLEGPEATASDA